ncbi:carbamoyl-phosphate synthase L chain, ATP binding domain-containing protein, partial [Paraphysoderma sedebokerense]
QADEAVHIGASQATESYLCIDKLIDAAKLTQADAIHPGYGFLSENADFSRACFENGIKFIGPAAESILAVGDKIGAKNLLTAKAPHIPLVPGYNGDDQSMEVLVKESIRIASAGGGGKGMRVVRDKTKLREEIEMAKSEGKRSFGNDKLLIERYFENVKHIEVQIIGDQHGNVYHCFERECSMQRRHQKVIEETPSPLLSPTLRQQITSAAVAIGKSINYEGAGTVEFILDVNEQKFYFLEVNTRLQVEHPVTECITGLDLVELQIKVAEGHSLQPYGLDKLKINGHAIECRLYAEDAYNNFAPCSGQLRSWRPIPPTEGIRYDSGIITGSQISIFYDPMISKLITWAPTRELAIQRMAYTLLNTVSLGLTTNKAFLYELLTHNVFSDGTYTTRFIGDYLSNKKDTETKGGMTLVLPNIIPPKPEYIVTAGMLWFWYLRNQSRSIWKTVPSGYRNVFYRPQKDQFKNTETNEIYEMEYTYVGKIKVGGEKVVNADKDVHVFSVRKADGNEFKVEIVDGVVNRSRGGVVNGYLRLSFGKFLLLLYLIFSLKSRASSPNGWFQQMALNAHMSSQMETSPVV